MSLPSEAKYTIGAIPTTYRDHNFRSRLEAKWAAFFDLNGWPWIWEPLDTGVWSPDFRVEHNGAAWLIDVKPWGELILGEARRFEAGARRTQRRERLAICGLDFEHVWALGGDGRWWLTTWGYFGDWAEAGNAVQWHPEKQRSEAERRRFGFGAQPETLGADTELGRIASEINDVAQALAQAEKAGDEDSTMRLLQRATELARRKAALGKKARNHA